MSISRMISLSSTSRDYDLGGHRLFDQIYDSRRGFRLVQQAFDRIRKWSLIPVTLVASLLHS